MDTDHSKSDPLCPACKKSSITFSRVVGPSEQSDKLEAELKRLHSEFKSQEAEIERKQIDEKRQVKFDDQAAAWLSENPDESPVDVIKSRYLDELKKAFAAKRASLVDRYRSAIGEVVVVYCRSCGHVLGPAVSPMRLEESLARIDTSLALLLEAVKKASRDVAALLAPAGAKLTELEARSKREEVREETDRTLKALRQLAGDESDS
jgi:hypothetical protein